MIVWGAHLDARVRTLEERGSPQVSEINTRLTRVEERQKTVIEILRTNSDRLEGLSQELKRHETDKR